MKSTMILAGVGLLIGEPAFASPKCGDGYHAEMVGGYGSEAKCVPYARGTPGDEDLARYKRLSSSGSGISVPDGSSGGARQGGSRSAK